LAYWEEKFPLGVDRVARGCITNPQLPSQHPLLHLGPYQPSYSIIQALTTKMSTMTIYTGPDPDTTTRAEYTIHHLNRQCPTVCSPRFSHIFKVHQTLIRLMDAHPAMDQNRDQTYNTPAASKNKVYFM